MHGIASKGYTYLLYLHLRYQKWFDVVQQVLSVSGKLELVNLFFRSIPELCFNLKTVDIYVFRHNLFRSI